MRSLGSLRPLLDAELELVRSWRNAPAVRANMYTQHEISQAEHGLWWDGVKHDARKQYFIYEGNDGAAGVVAFTAINPASQNCSWAFYAAPTAPPGTGGRMEYLALEHAFFDLRLHKLYCEVLSSNTPVLRLHKKFGFVQEGVFREHYKGACGFIDVHRLGILDFEWRARRAEILAKLSPTTDREQAKDSGAQG